MIMKIICEKCGYAIDRDKRIKGHIVEEYKNIYGTYCPKCGELNKSFAKLDIMDNRKDKMELLREEMRNKLRRQ